MSAQIPLFGKTDAKPSKKVAARVEEIVGDGFDVRKFVENFEVLVEAAAGVEKLRGLVLHLAVRGRLLKEAPMAFENTPKTAGLSVPFGLPRGWMWRRVEEVGDLKLGRQRSPKNHSGPNMRPYLRVANVFEARIDTADVLEMNFDPGEAERFLLEPNDVLLNEGQSYELVGRPAIYRGEVPGACFQNTLIRFRPSQVVLPEFALAVFRAYMRTGRFRREAQQTTNIAHLSLGRLAEIEFPLPPLAEQKRIVAKVDQLMALCDDLEARQTKKREIGTQLTRSALEALTSAEGPEEFDAAWKKVVENFDMLIDRAEKAGDLRRAILELAVRGRLAAHHRLPGGTAAGDGRMSKPFALPHGWSWAKIEETFDVVGGIQKTPARVPKLKHHPYLRVENVQRGRLDLGRIERFELTDGELERWRLEKHDLLVVEGNGSEKEIGRCALWTGDIEDCVHQNHIIRCRAIGKLKPAFTLLFLNSPSGMTEMKGLAITTSGLFSLSVGKVRGVDVPVPPPEEQEAIVVKVEQLMKVCDELEEQLRRAEHRANKLVEAVVQELVA
jgi:type I restriction enzyme, S subunit